MRLGPSTLTIGGLIKHLAWAEDIWFDRRVAGNESATPWAAVDWEADPDWEFRSAVDDEPEELLRLYHEACERARAGRRQGRRPRRRAKVPNGRGECTSAALDPLPHDRRDRPRHAGHADLIRETHRRLPNRSP